MLWTENIYDVQASALAELIMRKDSNCFDVADILIGIGDYVLVSGYADSSCCWIESVASEDFEIERYLKSFLVSEWNFCTADSYHRELRRVEVWHVVPDVMVSSVSKVC